jgi:hypothetical protein
MQSRRFAFWMLLLATPRAVSQVPDIDPPIVGQPPNFNGIVGRVRVETSVDPKEAIVEEPLMFVVRVLGDASAKHPPRRELLRIFSEEAEHDFWIEPVPDRDVAKPGLWEFVYRLRAKHADVKEAPAVKLVYFHPDRRRYQTSFADPIAVTLRPRPAAPVAGEPKVVHAPAVILRISPLPSNLAAQTGPWLPSAAAWLAALLVPPLLILAGSWFFLWFHPSPEAQRRRSMHQAARQAIEELKRTDTHDAEHAVETVKRYVSQRFGWTIAEWGPREAESALKRRGLADEARAMCVRFLAAWDRRRFDPRTETTGVAWNAEARAVIETVEADPCVASS